MNCCSEVLTDGGRRP